MSKYGDPVYLTSSQLKRALNTQEIRELVIWFIESYDAGWRPEIHFPTHTQEMRNRMVKLMGPQED